MTTKSDIVKLIFESGERCVKNSCARNKPRFGDKSY